MTNNALCCIQLLWQPGTPAEYVYAATYALRGVTTWLGMENRIKIQDIGSLPGLNVDELFQKAREVGRRTGLASGQASIRAVGRLIRSHVKTKGPGSPRVFLVATDDYAIGPWTKQDYVFGHTYKSESATVSTHRFIRDPDILDKNRIPLFSLMVAHEFGHLLNAADETRGKLLINFLGHHCMSNDCVMRQRDDLRDCQRDVLPAFQNGELFCPLCHEDITRFMNTHYPLAAA